MVFYLLLLSQPPLFIPKQCQPMESQERGQSYHPLKWADSSKRLEQQRVAIYQENISCQEKQTQIISLLTVLFRTAVQLSC